MITKENRKKINKILNDLFEAIIIITAILNLLDIVKTDHNEIMAFLLFTFINTERIKERLEKNDK